MPVRCSSCPICPKGSPSGSPIQPSGPTPCKLLLISDSPHKSENRRRRPLQGPGGKELEHQYLFRNGINRSEVGMTHAMCCSLPRYRSPEPELAYKCAQHNLPAQLEAFDPDYICLMGAVACHLAHPKPNLEVEHGIPFVGRIFDWVGVILPVYHPSAGLNQSDMMIQLQLDFPVLKDVFNGLEGHPVTDTTPQDYKVITSVQELQTDLRMDNGSVSPDLPIDTETDCQGFDLDPLNDPPYMLSYSLRPGHGRVIMANQPAILDNFNHYIREKNPLVVMHNSLFDVPVLERMGINIRWPRVHDTMTSAYLSGYLPQGLKALGYRLLNIRMSDYEDLVFPYSQQKQAAYLTKLAFTDPKLLPQPYLAPRQHKIGRKAMAAVEAWSEKGVDLQKRWKGWHDEREQDIWVAENLLGKFPYRSIVQADVEQAAYYACQDADVTGRLKPLLVSKLGKIREW